MSKRSIRNRRHRRPVRCTDVTVTIDGQPFDGLKSVSWEKTPSPGPARLTSQSYEASVDLLVEKSKDVGLDELAWRATVTPSSSAHDAFLVLVDALLEQGIISDPNPNSLELVNRSGVGYDILGQAWAWVRGRTDLSWVDLILQEHEDDVLRSPVVKAIADGLLRRLRHG